MEYNTNDIKNMSLESWNKTMIEELNNAGFRREVMVSKMSFESLPYEYEGKSYKKFLISLTKKCKGIDENNHLINVGLLNIGRCPLCGKELSNKPQNYYLNVPSKGKLSFHICNKCKTKSITKKALGIFLQVLGIIGFILVLLPSQNRVYHDITYLVMPVIISLFSFGCIICGNIIRKNA